MAEKDGLSALTVHGLAAALELTPGALYRYFESKDGFFFELQDHVQRKVFDLVRGERKVWDARGDGASGALYRLLEAARFYLRLRRIRPRYANLLEMILGDPRPLAQAGNPAVASSAAALFGELESLFEAAEAAKALPRGERREKTLAYWAALHGATGLRKLENVEPGLKTPEHYGMRMAETLLLGWGADPAELDKARRLLGARS